MATAVQPPNRFAQMRNWPHLPGGVRHICNREVLERRVCTATGQRPRDEEEAQQLIRTACSYYVAISDLLLQQGGGGAAGVHGHRAAAGR